MTSCALIEFLESAEENSTEKLRTKFGGQPDWLTGSQWPMSKTTGNPMCFIGQVALTKEFFPEGEGKMAYIFMTDEDEHVDGTWDPEAGENAVIIQPSSVTLAVECAEISEGPTVSAECAIKLFVHEDSVEQPAEGCKIAGMPLWLQTDDTPQDGDWQFLLQLESSSLPFAVNFGDMGIAYIFINKAATQGKFLWQC